MPIFLRTGKAMAVTRQTVTIVFKEPPMRLFPWEQDVRDARNALRFDIADPPGIALEFLGKQPGPALTVAGVRAPAEHRRRGGRRAPRPL